MPLCVGMVYMPACPQHRYGGLCEVFVGRKSSCATSCMMRERLARAQRAHLKSAAPPYSSFETGVNGQGADRVVARSHAPSGLRLHAIQTRDGQAGLDLLPAQGP